MWEERFERIETRLDRLDAGQVDLKTDVADLRGHMLVLHAELREEIFQRLDPLQAAVRRHFRP